MNIFKGIIAAIAIIAALIALSIGMGFFNLEYTKFFKPKVQNIERQVFEQTQSYSHGKTQDLAKYFEEYQSSDDKDAIRQIVLMNFADFDETTIRNIKLRSFLTTMRGY